MKTEKQQKTEEMKKFYHAHEDTNMAPSFAISLIYTFVLLLSKGQYLFQTYPIWLIFSSFTLFALSSTGFFLTNLRVFIKGYGYVTKPGYLFHFRIGNRYSTSRRGQLFYLSKEANLFGKFGLLVMVLITAIMTLLTSGVILAFTASKFRL